MKLKLIMALVDEKDTEAILKAARDAGCTGSTVMNVSQGSVG